VNDDVSEEVTSKEDGVMIENHMDTFQTYTQTIKMDSTTQDIVSTKKTPIHMHLIVNNYSQPTTPQSASQHFAFMSDVDVSNDKVNSLIEQNKELLERMNEMDKKMAKLSEEMEGLRWWRKGFYEWVRELRREWGSFKAGTLKLKNNKR
jgi:predicted RNase H-like nuclease (RuvC/YqgF family)